MATSIHSPSSADSFSKESRSWISSSSSRLNKFFSTSSEKCVWTTLRSRFDSFIDSQNPINRMKAEAIEQKRRLKQEPKLLLRGFDSMDHSMSLFSTNLHIALQGTRDLITRPPTFIEILEASIEDNRFQQKEEDDKRGLKRKLDYREEEEAQTVKNPGICSGKLKRAKNMANSAAINAATMAIELKLIRSELENLKGKCASLEEENKKLGQGLADEEDDLVRVQLEALLAEKSRLANENAKLARENECLHQLVEFHNQQTSIS